jgi:pimeloyl-ACP methyl ester carboxylesterase
MPCALLPSGVTLEYETRGRGEPVLLIAGLGRDRRMWDAQAPLAEGFRLVTFDNRGMGGSARPAGPYTAAMMADDAAGLLDALEIERAHVVGASLGGLIAQELALSRPERVRRLALLCTHPGVPLVVPCAPQVVAAMVPEPGADPLQRLLGAMKLAYGSRYWEAHADALAAAARARLSSMIAPEHGWAQAAAGGSFSWKGRALSMPTLVLTGDEDLIVPPANSSTLVRMIPGAELAVVEGGGHYFFAEQPAVVNRALAQFLSAGAPVGAPAQQTQDRKEMNHA